MKLVMISHAAVFMRLIYRFSKAITLTEVP
jgi:hypothetical protein